MANIIIVLLLAAAVGYGIYSFVHHLRCGGGCCGEHAMPGTWAAADLAAQQVSILTKETPDEAAIRQAIRDAGYLPLRTTVKQ